MREKHKLSMREARDEARYRISISTRDRDSSSPATSPDEEYPPTDLVCLYITSCLELDFSQCICFGLIL